MTPLKAGQNPCPGALEANKQTRGEGPVDEVPVSKTGQQPLGAESAPHCWPAKKQEAP